MQTQRATLWWALVALAVGATLLHYRVHPPEKTSRTCGPASFP